MYNEMYSLVSGRYVRSITQNGAVIEHLICSRTLYPQVSVLYIQPIIKKGSSYRVFVMKYDISSLCFRAIFHPITQKERLQSFCHTVRYQLPMFPCFISPYNTEGAIVKLFSCSTILAPYVSVLYFDPITQKERLQSFCHTVRYQLPMFPCYLSTL